jgi:hypothetical protein
MNCYEKFLCSISGSRLDQNYCVAYFEFLLSDELAITFVDPLVGIFNFVFQKFFVLLYYTGLNR